MRWDATLRRTSAGTRAAMVIAGRGRLPRPELPTAEGGALPPAVGDSALRVTFFGASALLLDDGHTKVLIDPFFSRPGAIQTLLGKVGPKTAVIDRYLRQLGVERLAAVIVTHSHYDHVMDAPHAALRTAAELVGSASTAMVGRGGRMPENQLVLAHEGSPLRLGDMTVTLIRSAHVPPEHFAGPIDAPLRPPARVSAYRLAECYSVHVRVRDRALVIQGSAGSVPGALSAYPADVVYLAVGTLGRRSNTYRQQYWNDVVDTVGAKRVILTHWDDLWRSLSAGLEPLPYLLDDLPSTLRFLHDRAGADGVDVRIPTTWQPTDPFAHL